MPILYRTSQYTQYNLIQEDPDPVKNRIFIENMGCDIKNLNIRFGEIWNEMIFYAEEFRDKSHQVNYGNVHLSKQATITKCYR